MFDYIHNLFSIDLRKHMTDASLKEGVSIAE